MIFTTKITYGYRWVVLVVLWISYTAVFLIRFSIGTLAPFLKEDLALNSAEVGLLLSAAIFGFMLSLLPGGWVVDKIGAWWPIIAGELIAGISMLTLFFVPSYTWLLVLMFAAGLGQGSLMPATTQGVMIWFPLRERATAMGLKQTSTNAAGIISGAVLPTVAIVLGWHYGFLFLGITALATGAIVFALYREPPTPVSPISAGAESSVAVMSMSALLKSREILILGLCGFALGWVQWAIVAHLVLYLTDVLRFSVVIAGGILALVQISGAITLPGSGILSDRIFGGNRKPALMLIAGTALAICLLMAFFGTYLSWAIYPVAFLLGAGCMSFNGIWLTLLSEFGGRRNIGKAVGIGSTVTMAGGTLGPVVFGHIVDISGSYQLAWLSVAFMSALCVTLLLFLKEENKRI